MTSRGGGAGNIPIREHGDDDDSVDPVTCGFARPLRSRLQEDCVLRGGNGGKMVSSDPRSPRVQATDYN